MTPTLRYLARRPADVGEHDRELCRDLGALAAFAGQRRTDVDALSRKDLEAFVRELMVVRPGAAIGGANGRLRARFLPVRRGGAEAGSNSPADDLRPPRAWPALPKFLSLEEVDRLLAQPDTATPRGLRDKALIEVLYATGLRVSELVSLRAGDLNLEEGYLTCIGKGDKQRMVPLGQQAVDWVQRYIREGRAGAAAQEDVAVAVRQRARRRAAVARRILEGAEGVRHQGGHRASG